MYLECVRRELGSAHHRVNLTPICVAIIAFEPAAHQAPTFSEKKNALECLQGGVNPSEPVN